jgi:osmotically-inducible protein OsmY
VLLFNGVRRCFRAPLTAGAALAVALAASGCAPLAVGAAAGGAAIAATEERGFGGFVTDLEIQTAINRLWLQHSLDMHSRLDMTVDSGRVLLLGRAKDAQQRLDAVRLAWQAGGVKEVINEIQVEGGDSSLVDSAKDTWISTQIRGRITFDLSVSSQNYTVDTVGGVVYLMGIAKSQTELDAVLQTARSVGGVQRVVSYVQLLSARNNSAPSSPPARP